MFMYIKYYVVHLLRYFTVCFNDQGISFKKIISYGTPIFCNFYQFIKIPGFFFLILTPVCTLYNANQDCLTFDIKLNDDSCLYKFLLVY